MAKKKPTKQEIETVVSGLINHVRFIEEKIHALDNLIGLYILWKEETDSFNEFVELKIKETTESITENEPGETK